jgi:hypothetical protein
MTKDTGSQPSSNHVEDLLEQVRENKKLHTLNKQLFEACKVDDFSTMSKRIDEGATDQRQLEIPQSDN